MYTNTPAGLMMQTQANLLAMKENQSRTARCLLTWTSTGIGEARTGVSLPFYTRFTEEPAFTAGMVLDPTTPLISGHYPRVGSGVYEWVIDSSGCYIGAYLFFTVDILGPGTIAGTEPNYVIHHNLVFEGKAVKDLPGYLVDLVNADERLITAIGH